MAISKIIIKNYKGFNGTYEIDLNERINIFVGDNDAGKSTILEAIQLATTGIYRGKNISYEISQNLFNLEVVTEYLQSIQSGKPIPPPSISIEVFFNDSIDPLFEGNNHTDKTLVKAEGFLFLISYNNVYDEEYKIIVSSKKLSSLPIEYYQATWTSFGRQSVTPRIIPIKTALIDSSNFRNQSGNDAYVTRIIRDFLLPDEITSIAQAHRNMRESFLNDNSISSINKRIASESSIEDESISISVELGTKSAWEQSLVTEVKSIPFSNLGKGTQCVIKTNLALDQNNSRKRNVILFEEPENHLSFSTMNKLLNNISKNHPDKQIIISTHSSFVANKLNLSNLKLISQHRISNFTNLSSADFFSKLAGYDTLRLLLCKKAILVEGPSDELIVQKAYLQNHGGKLPIQDGIDVISVGSAFLRFLEISDCIKKPTVVVIDNDGDIESIKKKFAKYLGDETNDYIKICYDDEIDTRDLFIDNKRYNYNTLESVVLKYNSLEILNNVFGTNYTDENSLRKFMVNNKTACALSIFESNYSITFPKYILDAIS